MSRLKKYVSGYRPPSLVCHLSDAAIRAQERMYLAFLCGRETFHSSSYGANPHIECDELEVAQARVSAQHITQRKGAWDAVKMIQVILLERGAVQPNGYLSPFYLYNGNSIYVGVTPWRYRVSKPDIQIIIAEGRAPDENECYRIVGEALGEQQALLPNSHDIPIFLRQATDHVSGCASTESVT
jgi:hypothetical protein